MSRTGSASRPWGYPLPASAWWTIFGVGIAVFIAGAMVFTHERGLAWIMLCLGIVLALNSLASIGSIRRARRA